MTSSHRCVVSLVVYSDDDDDAVDSSQSFIISAVWWWDWPARYTCTESCSWEWCDLEMSIAGRHLLHKHTRRHTHADTHTDRQSLNTRTHIKSLTDTRARTDSLSTHTPLLTEEQLLVISVNNTERATRRVINMLITDLSLIVFCGK